MGDRHARQHGARAATHAYRVFVSHATPDKRRAVRLCRMLESVGGVVTFRDDKDIAGGDDIPARIRAEVGRSDECAVLLTPNSIARPWVWVEVGMAMSQNVRVVPILCEVTAEQAGPLRFARAFGWRQLDRYLLDVQRRVRGRAT